MFTTDSHDCHFCAKMSFDESAICGWWRTVTDMYASRHWLAGLPPPPLKLRPSKHEVQPIMDFDVDKAWHSASECANYKTSVPDVCPKCNHGYCCHARYGSIGVCQHDSCIVSKRLKTRPKLLQNANRKMCPSFQKVPCPMILSDL